MKNPIIKQKLKEINEFRKQNPKCLSTSHTMSLLTFHLMLSSLVQTYAIFEAKVSEEEVKITIPRYK